MNQITHWASRGPVGCRSSSESKFEQEHVEWSSRHLYLIVSDTTGCYAFLTSAKEVMFSRVRLLVGFVGRIKQKKPLNGFPGNLDEGWVSAQNRPH